MLIYLIKFIHLLCVLGLLGCIACCVMTTGSTVVITRFNKILLWLGLGTIITGTLLVYPKSFTFHTPWIRAAYLLIFVFSLGILFINRFILNRDSTVLKRFILRTTYLALFIVLILIVHDAVTKMTFLRV